VIAELNLSPAKGDGSSPSTISSDFLTLFTTSFVQVVQLK